MKTVFFDRKRFLHYIKIIRVYNPYICNMKITKCTSLFLALLVLVSNIGLAFSVHYCGENIAGISSAYTLYESQNDEKATSDEACCSAKANEGKSCCKDKIVKIEKKSDIVVKVFSFQLDAALLPDIWKPLVFQTDAAVPQNKLTSYYCDAHAPPLYQLYSQYIFYA